MFFEISNDKSVICYGYLSEIEEISIKNNRIICFNCKNRRKRKKASLRMLF